MPPSDDVAIVTATSHRDETIAAPPPGPVALALWASALRCVLTYVALPALAPVTGAAFTWAIPFMLLLFAFSLTMSTYAIVRTCRDRRWSACTLSSALVVLNLLGLAMFVDARMIG